MNALLYFKNTVKQILTQSKNIQQIIIYHSMSPAEDNLKTFGHKEVPYHIEESLSGLNLWFHVIFI